LRCEDIQELLIEYASDELAPAQADQVQEHIASCAACRESVRSLRAILEAIWEAPSIEPTHLEVAAATASARAALTPRVVRRPDTAPLGRLGDWAFALGSVLVLGLAVAVQRAFSEPGLLRAFLADAFSQPVVLVVSIVIVASFLPICMARRGIPNGNGTCSGLQKPFMTR
jgi:anti-sigma factor RsiW